MSFGSQYNLNQRITYLEYLFNNLPPFPPTSTLSQVLTAGNNAGNQSINGISSESFFGGIDIKDVSNNSIVTSVSTGDMAITCLTNQLILSSYDNTQVNAGVGFRVIAGDYVSMVANNDNMSFQADDDISLTSVGKGIVLTAGDGSAGVPDITLTSNLGKVLEVTPLVSLIDGLNNGYINLDMRTAIDGIPTIEIMKDSLLASISKNNDLFITTDQGLKITCDKSLEITTNFDNIHLLVPNGRVFVERNLGAQDGDIYASTFVGSLNGNANTANFATTAGSASTATSATQIQTNNTVANLTHYINFSDSSSTGIGIVQKTAGISCNPSLNTITATGFNGSLTGTASNANAVNLTSDNTATLCYIPFAKTTAGSARPLFVDDTTGPLSYNPSTSTLTATNFVGSLNTTGLVFLQTLSATITGSVTATTFTLPSIFNTTYKNYKILFTFGENSFVAYPSVSLNGYIGSNIPTTGDLYGYDMTSGALTPVNLANQTLSLTPLQLTGACLPNIQIEFDVFNVGYTTLQSNNIVKIVSNSVYNNPGVKGIRNVTAMTNQNSSSTITGLSLQSILGTGNNPTWTAKIYGFK